MTLFFYCGSIVSPLSIRAVVELAEEGVEISWIKHPKLPLTMVKILQRITGFGEVLVIKMISIYPHQANTWFSDIILEHIISHYGQSNYPKLVDQKPI